MGEIVSKTKNFVFILTDNIFDSKWCKVELAAAIKAKAEDTTGQKNIVLLVKEGSRWADDKGSKICEFPPYRRAAPAAPACFAAASLAPA